jgi:hypothetical protein
MSISRQSLQLKSSNISMPRHPSSYKSIPQAPYQASKQGSQFPLLPSITKLPPSQSTVQRIEEEKSLSVIEVVVTSVAAVTILPLRVPVLKSTKERGESLMQRRLVVADLSTNLSSAMKKTDPSRPCLSLANRRAVVVKESWEESGKELG